MEESKTNAQEVFARKYSILIDDIKYIKSRQWTITYYLLLLYPAIVSFYRLMEFDKGNDFSHQETVLFLVSILVAILGTIYQIEFHTRIHHYRELILEVLNHLPSDFKEFERKDLSVRFGSAKKYGSRWNGFFLFTLPFIIMLWIGAGFVCWYFYHNLTTT